MVAITLRCSTTVHLLSILVVMMMVRPSNGGSNDGDDLHSVPLTVVKGAVAEGAVCLDGSPPVYQWAAGRGGGVRNWIIFLQGGGWCLNTTMQLPGRAPVESCAARATIFLASSRHMAPANFTHALSPLSNTSYFYNWNRVFVRYCDGGSFAGNADKQDPVTHVYYRGARIFDAVVRDLMARGLKDARNVLFAGVCGRSGAMVHCDRFCGHFPKNVVRVKCLADSSFFLRVKDPSRAKFLDRVFRTVVDVQRPHRALPAGCTSKMSAAACFFPQNLLRYIKSPIFIINPVFDAYQIKTTFSVDLNNQVTNHTVSRSNMTLLQGFRRELINALPPAKAGNGSSDEIEILMYLYLY
ncbi:hypothetical protein DM860_001343 [Cuscuta australis]|uniref:Pectin acetylesterase n=1 Tax=Cuscuta australis TaxID=267555 RepID=A0A328DY22_9ASTE|nr:hypothetical protein DM860_001343 [Cuscuta australis]